MDAVTYPDTTVSNFLNERMIPIRVPHSAEPFAIAYNVHWTPTLLTLDAIGKEHHRILGFLPPEELVPALLLGIAKMHFDLEENTQTISILDKLLATYAKSAAAPEAVYLRGVSLYKTTHNAKSLKEAHESIKKDYPNSEWVYRSSPYRLLVVKE